MSETTAAEVRRTATLLATAIDTADNAKRACLEVVASGLPAAIDAIAKRTAQAQPDVTKGLGVDGIRTMRAELATAAGDLAAETTRAMDGIDWPVSTSRFSPVMTRNVQSSFFTFFYGPRVDRIAALFKRHGYDIHDDNDRGSQGLVHPHSLYSEDDFAAVAEAQNALARAQRENEAARKADDEDVVANIWGDS